MVPTEVLGELKHLYVAAGELLRHFWSCFPVNTPFLEEKVNGIQILMILAIQFGPQSNTTVFLT